MQAEFQARMDKRFAYLEDGLVSLRATVAETPASLEGVYARLQELIDQEIRQLQLRLEVQITQAIYDRLMRVPEPRPLAGP